MGKQLREIVLAVSIASWAAILMASPARADAIDGDWCFRGLHMTIEGANITTPARTKVEGQYNRYRFAYVVPAGEQGAGGEITMVMIRGQEIVHLRRPGQTGEPEVWQRCKPIS